MAALTQNAPAPLMRPGAWTQEGLAPMSIPQPNDATKQLPVRWRDGTIRAYAKVDAADFPALSGYTWRLVGGKYVARTVGQSCVYLHRQLLGLAPGDGKVCDHINGDPLDNRRVNIRVGTQAQNCQNCTAEANAHSRHRGVSFDSRPRRAERPWRARVGDHWIGYFATEEEAAQAASDARRRLMPYSNEDRVAA